MCFIVSIHIFNSLYSLLSLALSACSVSISITVINVNCQSLDMKQEAINLELSEKINIRELPSKVPTDHARYHFFIFQHTHEGGQLNTIGNIATNNISSTL